MPGLFACLPVIVHDDEQTRMKVGEPRAAPQLLAPALCATLKPALGSHVQQPLTSSHIVFKSHLCHEQTPWRGNATQRAQSRSWRFASDAIVFELMAFACPRLASMVA